MDAMELLQAVIDSPTRHAILVMDPDGTIRLWNAGAARIFQYFGDEVIGRGIGVLFATDDVARGIPDRELATALRDGCAADCRWHVRKNGTLFWGDGMIYPVLGRTGEHLGYVEVLLDRTDEKHSGDATSRLALQDSLTGLSNRASFHGRFVDMAASAKRHRQLLILMLVDLDHFKQVNDDLGHAGGDLVLQQAAQRMRAVVRDTDVVARLGGDEFAILLPDAGSVAAGAAAADKLIKALSKPFGIGARRVRLGASVGLSVYPQDAVELDPLLIKADHALYRAKAEGRGGYCFHTAQMDETAHHRNLERVQLRRAVRQRAFSLHYQPQVDRAGAVIGVEALLRCTSEYFARYSVHDIVELAVETGRLRRLGLWGLAEASRQVRKWQLEGRPGLCLIMNFCGVELNEPEFAESLMQVLRKADLSPSHLKVDIVEPHRAEDLDPSPILDLHRCGVSLAIDDLGTGGLSLKQLLELPIDTVKLDLRIIPGLPSNPRSRAIATALAQLCHSLGVGMVAERIETPEQADFIQPLCDAMQGFHFARPMTADETTAWLLTRASADARTRRGQDASA